MVRVIPNDVKVEVLFETGTRKPKTIADKAGIPLRSVRRYVSKLKRGESLERKAYSSRGKIVTKNMERKILKMLNRRKPVSLRRIAASTGISHTQVRSIIKEHGYQYQLRKRRMILTNEMKSYTQRAFSFSRMAIHVIPPRKLPNILRTTLTMS